jgi:hypothetical protein
MSKHHLDSCFYASSQYMHEQEAQVHPYYFFFPRQRANCMLLRRVCVYMLVEETAIKAQNALLLK